jgi:hypothetical protein
VRKLAELMKDLGFNKEASLDVKKAFVRHLVTAADRSSPPKLTPISKPTLKSPTEVSQEVQLSFDPELLKAK